MTDDPTLGGLLGPRPATSARCRSCAQPILWARTTSGKAMPVDPDRVPGGNVDLVNQAGHLTAVVRRGDARPAYVSHFSTCPEAAQHRRPR